LFLKGFKGVKGKRLPADFSKFSKIKNG